MAQPGLRVMFSAQYATRSFAIAGATMLAAVNVLIASTVLPSAVKDIGGQNLYAWSTTLYVVASIIGASIAPRMLARSGALFAYRIAILVFFLGALVCTIAPTMEILLGGRTVQGFGGGFMAALTYAVIRQAFPQPLWPRAFAITNAMWGIATVAGPTIGGVFSTLGVWRLAFGAVLPIAVILLVLFERSLRGIERQDMTVTRFPALQLGLLAGAVLAVSAGSISSAVLSNIAGIIAAALLLAGLVAVERRSEHKLMPTGSFSLASPIGAAMATMVLLIIGVSAEIFAPYFLQELHGLSPLGAAYMVALLSAGWTLSALYTAGLNGRQRRIAIQGSPVVMLAGLIVLTITMPIENASLGATIATGVGLTLLGIGIGIAFSHLLTQILANAVEREQAGAASAMTTVQLVATAFGAAFGGVITNLTDYSNLASGGTALAATWYYGLFCLAPLGALFVARRVVRHLTTADTHEPVPAHGA
ncbi:MAG TPA: MFS transporter [Thermomicrobiales bacterium]|jgi:MFS family permease|nr:MFS transporter [Thermomicrobiales bacterium]